ncbi:EamA family transporter [Meridianimaribacter flavus]|uniref:EamA-like transporter family protein n=1 Tax=Meridianimaribacter flavus TaxID=571115 RepID=A0ABY2G6G0_9FLAO|nr:EamA family transporter [Meridianimaribacter flavus]TDY12646.1 EamA-like transporter family protein [Meridianimaribacter flavus]
MYLVFSILASTLIFIVFKLFQRFKIDTTQAIVVNYFIACIVGLIAYDSPISISEITNSKWFLGAVFLGVLFISIFIVMAITVQKNGVSVASVASKMSVVIPVIFGIYVYNESTGFQKLIGILLALAAVYLASIKAGSKINFKKNLLFPILLFLGSGVIDTSIKYLETTYVPENGIPIFSATIFGCAALIGVLTLIAKRLKGEFKFQPKSLLGGITLGVINYSSIYFLLKALDHETFESSTLFTVNNVGIVMLSTLTGLILFGEKLSAKNWIGIVLAIVSIILVTLA